MVYKIQGNFNEDNFESIFKKLGPHFKLMYKYNTLFAALIDYNFVNKSESYLRNALRPSKDFYISEINEKNIMREEQSIIQWCRDNLVSLDRQKYEKEEQARLKEVMKAMDNMETILQEQMINKSIEKQKTEKQDVENKNIENNSIENKNKTEGKEGD